MAINNHQTCFWEVALVRDREAFLQDKRGVRYTSTYTKGNSRPVRLNRDFKSSIYASASTVSKRSVRLDKLAGRIGH